MKDVKPLHVNSLGCCLMEDAASCWWNIVEIAFNQHLFSDHQSISGLNFGPWTRNEALILAQLLEALKAKMRAQRSVNPILDLKNWIACL